LQLKKLNKNAAVNFRALGRAQQLITKDQIEDVGMMLGRTALDNRRNDDIKEEMI